MSDTDDGLPDFDECEDAAKAGQATALQVFIYDNEPAGYESESDFRRQLAAVVRENAELAAAHAAAAWQAGRDAAAVRCESLREFGDAFAGDGNSKAWARAAESLRDQVSALTPPVDLAAALAAHTERAVQAEREACAEVAEMTLKPYTENSACRGGPTWRTPDPDGWPDAIAAAIRARGTP